MDSVLSEWDLSWDSEIGEGEGGFEIWGESDEKFILQGGDLEI